VLGDQEVEFAAADAVLAGQGPSNDSARWTNRSLSRSASAISFGSFGLIIMPT